jgi:hypothetical protein
MCKKKFGNIKYYNDFINEYNRFYVKKFIAISVSERIVFVPHCMRSNNHCCAIEKNGYYICMECGNCNINYINILLKKLHYNDEALYILKGSTVIKDIIIKKKPKAIIGIACLYEGYQAFKRFKKNNLIIQFIPLLKDGCNSTETNLLEVARILQM